MKKARLKTILLPIFIFLISISLIYGLVTTLTSPSHNTVDDDGWFSMIGTCTPSLNDSATSFNVTNATLYHDFSGTWEVNETIELSTSSNVTSTFDFSEVAEVVAEGTYNLNIL